MTTLRETSVQRAVKQLYESVGCKVWRFSQHGKHFVPRHTPGIPDLYVMVPRKGFAFWHESKTIDGRVSEEQRTFIFTAISCGVRVVIGGEGEAKAFLRAQGIIK